MVMQLDTRIPLSVQVPSAQPIAEGLQGLAQRLRDKPIRENQLAMQDLALQEGKMRLQQLEQQGRFGEVAKGAVMLDQYLQNNDVQGATQFLQSRAQELDALQQQGYNVDSEETKGALQMLQNGQIDQLKNSTKAIIDYATRSGALGGSMTADQRAFSDLTKGLTPEEQENARRIKLGLAPRAVGSSSITTATTPGLTTQVSESQKEIKRGEELGKGQAKTAITSIDEGRQAAQGIPVLKRSLALLDEVRTGGFAAAAIKAKQAFGIEAADEGELSANLGQAVLGDLRATFGAAFTEKEGERLERIRANLSRSPAANRRLIGQALQIAEDAALRAMDDAIEAGDTRTAEEIQRLLDMQLNDEYQSTTKGPPSVSTDEQYNALPSGAVFIDPNGQQRRKP